MSDWQETGLPCHDCGSRNNVAINTDGWSTCFGCGERHPPEGTRMSTATDKAQPDKGITTLTLALIANVPTSPNPIPERMITVSTVKKYGVVVAGERHIYPYYDSEGDDIHVPLAAQLRLPGKVFPSEGPLNKCGLFGQQLFPKGGRNVLVCEGAADTLAGYQLQGSKYPTVGVRNATAALSDCKRNYEYLDSFESIYIAMDNDAAGDKAAKELGELFGAKAKLIRLNTDYNDLCDILVDGPRGAERWKQAFFGASSYTPDGIVCGADMWELVNTPMEKAACQYPWEGLNAITYGVRMAELVTICAGSGLGKSQFIREIVWHLIQNTDENIGLLFLEENARKTGLSIMSLAADLPLHLPTTDATPEQRRDAFDRTLGTGRLFLFDHFGSTSIENIIARVRYQAKALGCKYIFLDHISIIVSAQDNGDERKAIDEVMTKMRMLVQELDIALFLVSHLKRPDGKGHEEGSATALSQLRGSASIGQLSDIVMGLERNGQHDDPVERNTTRIRVLKNRFSGETGKAAAMLYTKETGRMLEVPDTQDVGTLEQAL